MFTITEYTVERMDDPFNILQGNRYEFILQISVDEEDELYTEKGVYLRVIFTIDGILKKISQYTFHENSTNRYLEFELEEVEEKEVLHFCLTHYNQTDEEEVE
ncbi:pullulanase [Bacillus sp. BGMRC 2118]|nr:pullulanase [Bacillus sp. BGMRC 2118]